MHQGNRSNELEKQIVGHQYVYFIVRLFFKLSAYPFVNFLMFLKVYPQLNQKLFSIYQELKYITHCQDLQKTTHPYHYIPQNHILLTKDLWTYKNNLPIKLILTSLTTQHTQMTIHGNTEVGQLNRQWIILVLILIF